MRALDAELRRRFRSLMLAAAAVFLGLALLVQLGVTSEAEWRVQRLAQAVRTHALQAPMEACSLLGTGWVLLPAAVAVALVVLRARRPRLALALMTTSAGAVAASNLAKLLAVRQRPNTVMWAYPSAHTFGIVVFMVLLLYVLWAHDAAAPWRTGTLGAGVALTAAVGFSRLYLNAHWIGDVVGGVAGGLAFALGAVLVIDQRLAAHAARRGGASPLGALAG
jgi:undecaprenyl-diphosphatase